MLVLGVVSLVFCQLAGPVAWHMGNQAMREIDAEPHRYSNRSNVVTGRILGIISSVLLALIVGFFVFVIILGIAGASTGSSSDGQLRRPAPVVSVAPAD